MKATNILPKRSLLILLLSLVTFFNVQAEIETIVGGIFGTSIAASATASVQDQHYSCLVPSNTCNPPLVLTGTKLYAKLWFDDALRAVHPAWDLKVNFDIVLTNQLGTRYPVSNKELDINFDPKLAYTDIDYELYIPNTPSVNWYIKAEIKINFVTLNGISSLPNDVHLDLVLESEKYYLLDPTYDAENAVVRFNPTTDHDKTKNELKISWNYVHGAESYDLEYLFVDCGNDLAWTNDYDYDFKNATRINTLKNHHIISLAYPHGMLIFRARPRSPYIVNWIHGEGKWSSERKGTLKASDNHRYKQKNKHSGLAIPYKAFKYEGMDRAKNWQYTVSYAEEGKRKEVASFYDGALYNRQSVTQTNSNNVAIIGTSLYDFTGRPAVNVMPAPLSSTGIHYYDSRGSADVANPNGTSVRDNLNRNASNDPYSYIDFDLVSTPNAIPNSTPMSATNSTGAAKYYSSQNNITSINSDYIPEAGGLPFTRTVYTKDGTNRVLRQSGVGLKHQINKGHETKFLYAVPGSQVELDRLFGNNVGKVINYKKNLVLDPNGQGAVSYIDGKGRTIATALTGKAPNLLDLDTRPANPATLTANLTDFNQIVDDSLLISTKVILVQSSETYQFHYSVPTALFSDCGSSDCVYDLSIYLVNEESGQKVKLTNITNTSYTSAFEIKETVTSTISIDFKAAVSFGTYLMVKELKINQPHLQTSVDKFIHYHTNNTGTCYDFIPPPPVMSCGDCVYDCEQKYSEVDPLTQLKTFFDVLGNPTATFVYDPISQSYPATPSTQTTGWLVVKNLIDQCILECKADTSISPCEEKYGELLSDLSPGGQYFDNLPTANNAGYDINGWLTSAANNMSLSNFLTAITTTTTLNSWDDVRANWQDEWAEILVEKAHPEYCIFTSYCCVVERLNDENLPVGSSNPRCGDHIVQKVSDLIGKEDCGDCFVQHDSILIRLSTISAYTNFANTGSNLYDVVYKAGSFNNANPQWNTFHGANGIIGTGTNQIPTADFYTFQYNRFLEEAKYRFAEANCPAPNGFLTSSSTNQLLTSDGFFIHYPQIDWSGNNIQNQQSDICISGCEQAADQWVSDFKCADALSYTDQDLLKKLLFEVCKYSCQNDGEPNDTTSVAFAFQLNGNNYQAKTFHDVIKAFRSEYSLKEGLCPTPKFPESISEENCVCDNIFDFAVDHSSYAYRHLLPVASFATIRNMNLESVLFQITGDNLSNNYSQAFVDCMQGNAIRLTSIPSYLHCDNSPLSYTLANLDSLCVEQMNYQLWYNAKIAFDNMLAQKAEQWKADYIAFCMNNAYDKERFYYNYQLDEYHYTLYHYDQADNLVKTVSPNGNYQEDKNGNVVYDVTNTNRPEGNKVNLSIAYRNDPNNPANTFQHPSYAYFTNYKYNSLQQLVEQTTPDGGTAKFFYDKLGRLVASQNADQASRGNFYSYTRFDDLGRIEEVGELENSIPLSNEIARDLDLIIPWNAWVVSTLNKKDVVKSHYDKPLTGLSLSINQNHLRNRIASITYDNDGDGIYETASHYDYDVNGNVQTLLQENRELAAIGFSFKQIDYEYDLVSGNVNKVSYQHDQNDCFYHRYEYDADNRLTKTETSRNGIIWERESKSFYYPYGPLARSELGDKNVQGLDYAYTLQGWLKVINSSTGGANDPNKPTRDIGADGFSTTINQNFARDAYGLSLHYYKGDYTTTGSGANSLTLVDINNPVFDQKSPELFNGNISKIVQGLTKEDETKAKVIGNAYRYDVLNRLKKYHAFINSSNDAARINNSFAAVNNQGFYDASYKYDGDGNIDSLKRNGGFSNTDMDDFNYIYDLSAPYKTNNQLKQVEDNPAFSANYTNDLDNQPINNYRYDKLGRLTQDLKEEIAQIKWNVSNKITEIIRTPGSTKAALKFRYDAFGNRTAKEVIDGNTNTTTYYVRDAQGNVMATYDRVISLPGSGNKNLLLLNDFSVYGSSRLGVKTENKALYDIASAFDWNSHISQRTLGTKSYELSNHLGNVLEVISDRKLAVGATSIVDYYTADVVSYSDYYPFGMKMVGRYGSEVGRKYKYGFNGQEMDDEIFSQEGASYDLGARMYDSRIGRMRSTDSWEDKYAWQSPYVYYRNNPIKIIDWKGFGEDPTTKTTTTTSAKSTHSYLGNNTHRIQTVHETVKKKVITIKNKKERKTTYITETTITSFIETTEVSYKYDEDGNISEDYDFKYSRTATETKGHSSSYISNCSSGDCIPEYKKNSFKPSTDLYTVKAFSLTNIGENEEVRASAKNQLFNLEASDANLGYVNGLFVLVNDKKEANWTPYTSTLTVTDVIPLISGLGGGGAMLAKKPMLGKFLWSVTAGLGIGNFFRNKRNPEDYKNMPSALD